MRRVLSATSTCVRPVSMFTKNFGRTRILTLNVRFIVPWRTYRLLHTKWAVARHDLDKLPLHRFPTVTESVMMSFHWDIRSVLVSQLTCHIGVHCFIVIISNNAKTGISPVQMTFTSSNATFQWQWHSSVRFLPVHDTYWQLKLLMGVLSAAIKRVIYFELL